MNIHSVAVFTSAMSLTGGMAMAGGPIQTPAEPVIVPYVIDDTPRWQVILGGGVSYAPDFEGSDEFEASPFPFVSLQYGRFSAGPEALGFEVWEGESASFGVSLGYGGGRDPEDIDSGVLDGFAEIDDAAILGLRYGYEFGETTAFADLKRFLGESDGTSLELGVEREKQITERFSLSAAVSATLSDSNYMETYFGVTPLDAAATGYSVYEAGSGLRRIDVKFGASYGFSENWMLRGEIGIGKLMSDAADSPIVIDDVQPEAMLAVAYRF